VLPFFATARAKSPRISCLNNLASGPRIMLIWFLHCRR
jgi:hypothetical protein